MFLSGIKEVDTKPVDNDSGDDERINLVGIEGNSNDALPTEIVAGWPTWVLSDSGFIKIPDTADGYVNPSSTSLLWQPIDLNYPDMQLAVGIHYRNRRIMHVFPALDLAYGDGEHRNRGLNTVPRAQTWISVSDAHQMAAAASLFQMEILIRNFKKKETKWTIVDKSGPIQEALEKGIYAFSHSPLGDGSHIVHIPLVNQEKKTCPKVGNEIRVTLSPQNILNDSMTGILNVKVHAAQAGSHSKHLPSVYENLFHNKKLQRSEYVDFKNRQKARLVKDKADAEQRRTEREGKL